MGEGWGVRRERGENEKKKEEKERRRRGSRLLERVRFPPRLRDVT